MRKTWPIFIPDSILKNIINQSKSAEKVLRYANGSPRLILLVLCLCLAEPAAITLWEALRGTLGVNPLEILIREPGRWSLILLLLALAIAPLRHGLILCSTWSLKSFGKRMPDWNWLIRLRRPIGVASFCYAVVHVAVYVYFDLDLRLDDFLDDFQNKLYIKMGFISFIFLAPLAFTSTDGWMRRLKRNWKRLHSLIYPVSLLAIWHFLLLSKPGVKEPYIFSLVLFFLLAYRAVQAWKRGFVLQDRIDGTVPERVVEKLTKYPDDSPK